MYRVTVQQHFDAAHYLRGYQGKCEQVHGHRFQVVVSVEAKGLDDIGIAFDFVELKRQLNQVLDDFDHRCLNDVAPFDRINPSSENIAANIHERLTALLPGVALSSVEVWESPESRVTYIP